VRSAAPLRRWQPVLASHYTADRETERQSDRATDSRRRTGQGVDDSHDLRAEREALKGGVGILDARDGRGLLPHGPVDALQWRGELFASQHRLVPAIAQLSHPVDVGLRHGAVLRGGEHEPALPPPPPPPGGVSCQLGSGNRQTVGRDGSTGGGWGG